MALTGLTQVVERDGKLVLVIEGLQHKRKKASAWQNDTTTILLAGEIGIESDTLKLKVGDGKSIWINLPYVNGGTADGGNTYVLSKTYAEWQNDNTPIDDNVICFESDTARFKVSNGNRIYKDLPYATTDPYIIRLESKDINQNDTYIYGDVIYETDTHKIKIADGVTKYSDLPYLNGNAGYEYDDLLNRVKMLEDKIYELSNFTAIDSNQEEQTGQPVFTPSDTVLNEDLSW